MFSAVVVAPAGIRCVVLFRGVILQTAWAFQEALEERYGGGLPESVRWGVLWMVRRVWAGDLEAAGMGWKRMGAEGRARARPQAPPRPKWRGMTQHEEGPIRRPTTNSTSSNTRGLPVFGTTVPGVPA